MNYIRHLNAFFSSIRSDNRLTSSHVSLYLALFQYWNFNRFQNPFPVYRDNIMQLSKIGSKNTYHKCIKQLHHLQYIFYHPPVSKFQPVRISMIRLDIKQEASTFKQLDLFSIKNDTDSVPNLTDTSTDIDTDTVPNMGHNIKPNNKQERETPTHKIFKKNKKIQTAINELGGVPKSVPTENNTPSSEQPSQAKVGTEGRGVGIPNIHQVETFFQQQNYPKIEAKKFYNHYKAIGWKIQGVTPIKDWEALVEKWMINTNKWDSGSVSATQSGAKGKQSPAADISYLYESFIESKKIFHHITTDHFTQLKLTLTEETIHQARQERIKEVTGTNQHSLNQLWDAYLKGDDNNPLLQKDKPNLIALAKRIAVLNHFHTLKQSGAKSLPP